MKRKQAARLSSTQKQGGFLLPQLAVGVLLLSVVMAWVGQRYWQDTVRQSGDDRARLVGTMASTVNDATKTYATTFFTQIQQAQTITRNGYTVPPARVLAPTTADLNALGLLPSRAINPIIYNGQSIGFKVQLTVDTSSGCTVPTCNLLFQVTTTAPLLNPRNNTVDVLRATMAATTASPGNAGVSMPVSFGGNPNVFVTSNGTQTGTNPGGVAGLISVSNGYDSSGFFMFDRRDGSLPRTGDINMQDTSGAKHNINNAGSVNAQTVNAGAVNGQTVTSIGRMTTGEYLQINGVVVQGTGCSSNGLMARSATGLMLSCQNGVWQKPRSGGGFIQAQVSFNGVPGGLNCYSGNPDTWSCSCKAGESPVQVSYGVDSQQQSNGWIGYYAGYICM
jgi:hypothetical protein